MKGNFHAKYFFAKLFGIGIQCIQLELNLLLGIQFNQLEINESEMALRMAAEADVQ